MEASITRTRQSVNAQIREALDHMVARGTIKAWSTRTHATDGRLLYQAEGFINNYSHAMTPGECMEWLARHGYDVQFGASKLTGAAMA